MADTTERKTRADAVYARIRADIFAARLLPGQRLKFPELCAAYDTSVGVAREALARLAVERLVRPQAHQGYSVIELSAEDVSDLAAARAEIEPLTFRLAVEHGGASWEAEVLSAHHLLSRAASPAQCVTDAERDAWHGLHARFHWSLLAGCPIRRLRETALALREEAELHRRWYRPLGGGNEANRDVAAEHLAMVTAALDHEADRAAGLLREHICLTARILLIGSVPEVIGEPVAERQ